MMTYPAMPLPSKKELRVIDGEEREVEVTQPLKRLFLFADKDLSR